MFHAEHSGSPSSFNDNRFCVRNGLNGHWWMLMLQSTASCGKMVDIQDLIIGNLKLACNSGRERFLASRPGISPKSQWNWLIWVGNQGIWCFILTQSRKCLSAPPQQSRWKKGMGQNVRFLKASDLESRNRRHDMDFSSGFVFGPWKSSIWSLV